MPAKKPSQPQPDSIAPASTKPAIVALKPQKHPQTQPEPSQEVVEAPASVEPPASESQPKKVSRPVKRAKTPLPDITQETEATTTQSESSPEGNSSSLPSDALFQAVGIILGEVSFDENGYGSVVVEQKQYSLFYAPSHKKSFEGLKKEIERTGNHKQRLLVYPKVTHFPKREQNYRIAFQLVAFEGTGKDLKQDLGLSDFEFKLCGLWQFIPVCSIPCLSIFKNLTQERIAHIKESPVEHRVRFMKASHIPVLWRDAPVRPFRFNPKLDKEQQGQASFVGIIAKFLPERDVFGFSQLCIQPSLTPPKFLKAGKKDKAEVLQIRRQRG